MTGFAPDRPFCLTADGVKSRADLMADAARLRGALAGHDAVCNLIGGRYGFAALLLAAMAEDVPTCLPSARADEAVAAALAGYDRPLITKTMPESAPERAPLDLENPGHLPGEVSMFTSGSTGAPVRHAKRWRQLALGAGPAAGLIVDAGLAPGTCVIAGTTPHQHMYGMEAALFTGIAHGHCLWDGMVFYPADLEGLCLQAEAAGFEAVVLVTSPPHLTFLEQTIAAHPMIRCVISATAPLHPEIAERMEARSGAQVAEVYGSTESGSFATRRPTRSRRWTPMPDARLIEGLDGWQAITPLLEMPVPMSDRFDVAPDGRFTLLGRSGDMVRISGKRQSLGALNAVLAAMPGLSDGAVLRESRDGEDILHVLVVPGGEPVLDRKGLVADVRAWMLAHLDPVFVPRQIRVIDHLPRNATGKIPREAQARLVAGQIPARAQSGQFKSNAK